MSEWKEERLKSIAEIRISNVDKKIYPNKSIVRLCNYMDVYRNDYIENNISFSIGSADDNQLQKFSLKKGDVIITKDSETPEDIAIPSVVVEKVNDVVCGYHLAILRPDSDKIEGAFLMQALKLPQLRRYFYSVANGSTRYGLTIANIEGAKIRYPSIPLQRKISDIIYNTDCVIQKTQSIIAKYQAIKQGMLQDLFTRGIDVKTGKLRPTYKEAPKLYKKSKLGMIPKEWEMELLIDCCNRISVGIATSSSRYFANSGVLFLRNQNIKENYIDLSDTMYITRSFADANSSKYLKEGDVITVRTGYPGISAVVSAELHGAQTFTTLITTPNTLYLNSYYLSYFINSDFGRKQVQSLQGGGAQQNLNSRALETMKILKPNLNEQKIIVQKLKSIEENIKKEQSYLQKLQQLKSGLMNDLLSGKKKVNLN